MNWVWWLTVGCWCIAIVCMSGSIYYSRKSLKLHEITRKLYSREPLTAEEQRILDKIR